MSSGRALADVMRYLPGVSVKPCRQVVVSEILCVSDLQLRVRPGVYIESGIDDVESTIREVVRSAWTGQASRASLMRRLPGR